MANIAANGSKGHHKFTLDVVENSYNIANNTSEIAFTFKLAPIQSGWDWSGWGSSISYTVTIDGTAYSGTIPSYNGSSTVTLKSGTQTVYHNNDGTKSISFNFSVKDSTGKNYTCGTASASGSLTLTTIPRTSSIASISGGTLGQSFTVNINRASSSFTHLVRVTYGSSGSQDISTNAGTSATATLSKSIFCPLITNTNSVQALVTVTTYSGGTAIGSVSQSFTMTVPTDSDTIPSVDTPAISGASKTSSSTYAYVQTKSTIVINVTASGRLGSWITGCSVEVQNGSGTRLTTLTTSYNNSTQKWVASIANINYTGTVKFVATVTDSRGKTKTSSAASISVYAYSAPKVTALTASRNTSTPTNVTITFSGTISQLNGAGNDSRSFTLQYKTKSATNWTTLQTYTGAYTYTNQTFSDTTHFAADTSYDIRVVPHDYITENGSIISTDLGTEFELMHFYKDGTGIAFGKKCENSNAFECKLNANFTGNLKKNGVDVATVSGGSSSRNIKTNLQEIEEEYPDIYNEFKNLKMYNYDYKYKNIQDDLISDYGFIIDDIEDSPHLSKYFRNYVIQKYITQNNELVNEAKQSEEPILIKEWDSASYIKGLFIIIKSLQDKIEKLEKQIENNK